MNKIFKTMMLAAITAFGMASCEDVPAPFIEPEQPETGGSEEITLPYFSANLKDGFEVHTPTGMAWSLGNTYAKATGYNSGTTTASESYLITPAINLGDAEKVYVDFNYVIAYTNSLGLSEGHKVLVCTEYDSADPTKSNWITLSFDPKEREDRNSWDMYPANTLSIPESFLGKTIRIAFLYKCNGTSASTWELTNLKVSTEPGGEVAPDTPVDGDAQGDGSLNNPFNAAGAHNYVTALPAGQVTSEKFYIKGIVCESSKFDISTQYKNATFHISEDGTAEGTQFLIFRTKGLNGADITSKDDVKVGDEVVVYAQLVNYMGNTPETSQGGIIYSQKRNGQDMGNGDDNDTPSGVEGDGTLENPWNIVGVLKAFNDETYEKDSEYYVKGIITEVSSFNSKYSSISYYISDDTNGSNKFYIYSGLGLNQSKFSGQNDLHVGDEVVVCGKLTVYNDEPQFNYNNYLVSHKSNSNPDEETDEETESNASFFKASDLKLENGAAFTSVSVHGVTLSVTDGGNNNSPKYYDNGSNLRMYPKNTLTISTEKVISSIKLNCTSGYVASGDASSDKGTIKVEDPTITISNINDKSFTLTNTSTTTGAGSQIRIESFEITYAE